MRDLKGNNSSVVAVLFGRVVDHHVFPRSCRVAAVQEEDLSLRCEALRIQLDRFQASEAVGTLALDGTCGEDAVTLVVDGSGAGRLVQYASILKMLTFLGLKGCQPWIILDIPEARLSDQGGAPSKSDDVQGCS